MGSSVLCSWLAALSCLLCLGVGVQGDCSDRNIQIEGGEYILSRNLSKDSLLVYKCKEGYYPYPTLTRLCQSNGSWRPTPRRFPQQKCRRVECPDPNVLQNGNVSPPQENYFVDNETTYECYSGYTLRGSFQRTCLPNGKWSGFTPICSRDSGDVCADPGIPPGASRTGNIFGIDDKVHYRCTGNMFLVGSKERTCQENGQWTGQEPACYYKYTYDTPLEVSEAFGAAIKDRLTTVEHQNDPLVWSPWISKNETLNIYIAADISESIDKKKFKQARDAVISLIKKIASFSVSPNYEIIFFSSEVYEVVNILDFLDATAELKDIIKNLEDFEVGDENTGLDLNAALVKIEGQMVFIKQRAGPEGFKEHRHVLIMFTDGAYNLGGSPRPTVERIKNMVYMSDMANVDSRDEYLDIYIFAVGADLFDDDLQPLTVGTGGAHYFRMKDMKELQEAFDTIIGPTTSSPQAPPP